MVFLLRLLEEFDDEMCLDNSSATGLIDKDPPLEKLEVGGALEFSSELLFVELTGVGILDGNGGGDEC